VQHFKPKRDGCTKFCKVRRKRCDKACNSALRSIQDVGPCAFRPWWESAPSPGLHNCTTVRNGGGRTDLLLPAAACRRQCMRPMLPQICMRNECGLEHHAVCGNAHDSESRECPSGRGNPSSSNGQLPIEASGYELTRLQASATSLSTCPLGNIFLQLLVVALRLRFLVRLLRVTSEDAAAPPPRETMINAYAGRERPRGWSFLAHHWELIIVSLVLPLGTRTVPFLGQA